MQCHAKPCPSECMSRELLCIDIFTSCLCPSVCDWNSTSDKTFHASFQVNLQPANYSSTTLVHTTLFSIFWSQSQTFIHIEADHMRRGNVAKLVKHLFELALSISQSRFVCGKCIKKSITLFCRSKSQPTWCIIVFITFVMIIEPIWRPTRRLVAWFVDDRAIICKAGTAVILTHIITQQSDYVQRQLSRRFQTSFQTWTVQNVFSWSIDSTRLINVVK